MVRPMVKREAGRRVRHNGLTNGEKRGRAESATQWSDQKLVKKEAGRRARHNGQTNGERGRAESTTQWSDQW